MEKKYIKKTQIKTKKNPREAGKVEEFGVTVLVDKKETGEIEGYNVFFSRVLEVVFYVSKLLLKDEGSCERH